MLQLRVNELEKKVSDLEKLIKELEYQVACQHEDMRKMYENTNHFTQKSIDYFNSANQTMQIHTKMINDLTELKKMDIVKPKRISQSSLAIMIIGTGLWVAWALISMMPQ